MFVTDAQRAAERYACKKEHREPSHLDLSRIALEQGQGVLVKGKEDRCRFEI